MSDSVPIRILLVGGNASDDRLLRRLLIEARRPEWAFSWMRSVDTAMERLSQEGAEVVLFEQRAGWSSAFDVVRQSHAGGRRTAFVVLTAKDDREEHEAALRAGAMDTLPRSALTATLFDRVICGVLERQRAQEVVRESEERFRAMANAAPAPLYVKTTDGRGVFFNQGWLDFRGRGHAQECGDGWQEGLHPEDGARVLALMTNALHQRMPFRVEYRLRRHDGEYCWVLDIGQPRFHSGGVFAGYAGVLVELSGRVGGDQAGGQAGDEADVSRLKAQFLANMAQGIRMPMNGIIGMTGLLLDTHLTHEQRELAEAVQKSSDDLQGIINDILGISKIEARGLQIEAVEFELRSLVEDTVASLGERTQDKGLELICEIPFDLPVFLRGDPKRLRQVLTNLTDNAIKFTDQGEVLVSVSRVEETESAIVIRIAVQDTGIGITAEAKKLIFQSFQMSRGAARHKLDGAGLGLPISRQLVELMGGRLGLESTPGRGSTFWFELPLPKLRDSSYALVQAPKLPHNAFVLVVNANATSRRVLLKQLTAVGVTAEAAEGAVEALALMRSRVKTGGRAFDVVIVDRALPDTGCRQLAREIRVDSSLCFTALVMVTTASHLLELQGFKQSGFDAFLFKPIRQRQLGQCLGRLLARASVDRAADRLTERVHGPEQPVRRRGGLRVLVVEDNFVIQKVAQRHIDKLGHQAEVAENGARALDMLALQRYDVVFMDCQMPVLDGYEATRRIRAGQVPNLDPGMPVIALTAFATETDRQRCFAAGMDDVVAKPIRLEDIQSALDRRVAKNGIRHGFALDAAAAAPAVVLDRTRLDHLYGLHKGDDEFIRSLIGLFLAETPQRLEELRSARSRSDLQAVIKSIHTVQGAAANLGASALEQRCERIEAMALAGRLAELDLLISGLDGELVRLADALDHQKHRITLENTHR